MGKGPNNAYACHLHFDVFQVKPPSWGFWNGGAKSSNSRAVQVNHYFMPPRAFFQKYGLSNVVHKGGCSL
jgi:hypothetical protein